VGVYLQKARCVCGIKGGVAMPRVTGGARAKSSAARDYAGRAMRGEANACVTYSRQPPRPANTSGA